MHIALMSTCALATPPHRYGGTELFVADLAEGLTSLGHHVTVFATGDSSLSGELSYVFERPVWPPSELAEARHSGFAWQEIASAAKPFDVVHLNHAAALPYRLFVDRPTLMTIHHVREHALLDHYRAFRQVAYVGISARQVALSPELRFRKVVHHGLSPARYPSGDGHGGYVAFLGRFAPEKAPHVAIDVARAAGIPLRIGGNCHEVPDAKSYYENFMKPRLTDEHGVTICGELGHEEKIRLLRGARALLFPIQWEEPFGLVMIESMLVGTPVLAFGTGSVREVVEDGITGYVVNSEAEMLARLREIGSLDRKRCRARAQERFSSLRMARDYATLYQEMICERHTRVSESTALRFLPKSSEWELPSRIYEEDADGKKGKATVA